MTNIFKNFEISDEEEEKYKSLEKPKKNIGFEKTDKENKLLLKEPNTIGKNISNENEEKLKESNLEDSNFNNIEAKELNTKIFNLIIDLSKERKYLKYGGKEFIKIRIVSKLNLRYKGINHRKYEAKFQKINKICKS